jgi:hypothetical protein
MNKELSNEGIKQQWRIEEPEAILDYLHGDTPRHEAKACCYYEHARSSDVFVRAQRQFNAADFQQSLWKIVENFPLFRNAWHRLEILICPGFPKLPWRALSEANQKDIAVHFVKPRTTPLTMDSFILNSMGILDRFKKQAQRHAQLWTKRSRKGRIRAGQFPAITGRAATKYVVLTLDYSRGPDATKESLCQWLRNPRNKKLFKRHYRSPIQKRNLDSPDRYKELLKYLAAWRLYSELGFKGAKEWTAKNRRRNDYHSLLFFREKLKRTPGETHYRAPVFKERRQSEDAIARAKSFLATKIECR